MRRLELVHGIHCYENPTRKHLSTREPAETGPPNVFQLHRNYPRQRDYTSAGWNSCIEYTAMTIQRNKNLSTRAPAETRAPNVLVATSTAQSNAQPVLSSIFLYCVDLAPTSTCFWRYRLRGHLSANSFFNLQGAHPVLFFCPIPFLFFKASAL